MLNEKQHEQALINEYNFDHPDAFDMDLLLEVVKKLKEGRKVEVPVYNFVTHSREVNTVSVGCYNVFFLWLQTAISHFFPFYAENNVWRECDYI